MLLPLVCEAQQLHTLIGDDQLIIIDICKPDSYVKHHIPDAIHIDYQDMIRAQPPANGLLPEAEQMQILLDKIGCRPNTHIVCYDDEGGGNASRLIWTLHAYGIHNCSILNGGFIAWLAEGLGIETTPNTATNKNLCDVHIEGFNVINAETIMLRLDDSQQVLLDARSIEEFNGSKNYAKRPGHIPGAKHFEWTDAMDKQQNLRLLPDETLLKMLAERGITADKQIVVYCHTHHRSALSYVMLKHLNFTEVRGYHGAWSDWGNREDTPIETA